MAPDLSTELCRHRFGAGERAVLATAGADGVPHVVPVTFALLGAPDVVVTAVDHKPKRTTRLRRLRNVAEQPRVSLLVDGWSANWDRLWWVRADAVAEVIEADAEGPDGERRDLAVRALVERYRQYRGRPPEGAVVWARVTRWVGWAADGEDGAHTVTQR